MKEIWKDIEGYEGLYQISNLGKVRSLDRFIVKKNGSIQKYKGRILLASDDMHGYDHVSLSKGSSVKKKKIYRLVAETFIENPDKLKVVNHIDGNKSNNCVSNLEWCSSAVNNKHAWETGLKKSSNKQKEKASMFIKLGKNKKRHIICKETGVVFDSIRKAEKEMNINHSRICTVLSGKQESVKGFHFEYIEG